MRYVRSPIWTSGEPVSLSCSLKRSISFFLSSDVKTTFFLPPLIECKCVIFYFMKTHNNNYNYFSPYYSLVPQEDYYVYQQF